MQTMPGYVYRVGQSVVVGYSGAGEGERKAEGSESSFFFVFLQLANDPWCIQESNLQRGQDDVAAQVRTRRLTLQRSGGDNVGTRERSCRDGVR